VAIDSLDNRFYQAPAPPLGASPALEDPLTNGASSYIFGADGTSAYSFSRKWALSILTPGTSYLYTQNRMTFELEKSAPQGAVPLSQGKVVVYNLSDETRAAINGKGTKVNFAVGYNIPQLLYIYSDPFRVTSTRKGADILTTFELAVAAQPLSAVLDLTPFPKNSPLSAIIAAVVKAAGLILLPPVGLIEKVFQNAVIIHGTCMAELSRLLGDDYEISTDGRALQIVHRFATIATEKVFSATTGLLTTPVFGASAADKTVTFSVLLDPELKPGQTVILAGPVISGPVKLRSVKFVGDTHGNKWSSDCEAAVLG
jgi:hypothetical protein